MYILKVCTTGVRSDNGHLLGKRPNGYISLCMILPLM